MILNTSDTSNLAIVKHCKGTNEPKYREGKWRPIEWANTREGEEEEEEKKGNRMGNKKTE